LPTHIGDLIVWPQILLRIAMAIQTPTHGQLFGLKHQGHLINLPVTRRAANTLIHVNAVIEIYEIRQPVDLYPHNRFIGAIAFAHRLQVSGVFEQHRVAVHTGFGGRNSGLRGSFHAAVTIPTVDAIVTSMMFVAELDGLIADDVLPGVIGSAREHQDASQSQRHRQNSK
jgi:hypothetical protein